MLSVSSEVQTIAPSTVPGSTAKLDPTSVTSVTSVIPVTPELKHKESADKVAHVPLYATTSSSKGPRSSGAVEGWKPGTISSVQDC